MTAATAAVTLARARVAVLMYWASSSYVLITRIGLHRIELVNKTLVMIFQNLF